VRPEDQPDTWTEIGRSTTPVVNGVLGVFDATALDNGDYRLRLTAWDQYGNGLADETRVRVDGQAKVGLFTLTFEDMTISLPGMGLSVGRTYDSRVKSQGDFGIGWRMDLRTVRLTENRNQGTGWSVTYVTPNYPLNGYQINPSVPHTVSIAIPGGRTQVFDAAAKLYSKYDPTYGYISYEAKPGTYSTLEAVDLSDWVMMGGELYDLYGDYSETYNPQVYRKHPVNCRIAPVRM